MGAVARTRRLRALVRATATRRLADQLDVRDTSRPALVRATATRRLADQLEVRDTSRPALVRATATRLLADQLEVCERRPDLFARVQLDVRRRGECTGCQALGTSGQSDDVAVMYRCADDADA